MRKLLGFLILLAPLCAHAQFAKIQGGPLVGNCNPHTLGMDFVNNNIYECDGLPVPQWKLVGGINSQGIIPVLLRTNSPNCTTLNQLVEYDTTPGRVDANGVAEVQNAIASSKNVIGVVISGAGCSGVATIGTYLSANCITDNQSTIGDLVAASSSAPGQCTDYGSSVNNTVQTVGRVSKVNTGSGTLTQVDFFLGNMTAPGGGNGGGTVSNCGSGDSVAYYATSGTSVNCDPSFTDNGAGNPTAKSLGLTDPTQAGFFYLSQGTAPTVSALNSIYFYAPTSVTSYAWKLPGTAGTGCLQAANSSGIVTISFTGTNCGTGSGGTVEFQTNGVDNANCVAGACPLQNLVNGTNVTITNTSNGNVQISASGAAAPPQALNPTAPTLANQNAAGARSITYGVQMCEDGPTCAFHSTLVTATIANANASPQVLLSAFADTLYGYRCANIYVTADSGARTGVPGLIASCVWKKFIDTGANGNGVAATNSNTTQLDSFGQTNPLPGCNKIPGSPYGIDGVPCTPTKYDWEGTETFGIGDAQDPFFTFVNQGGATAGLTNGMVKLLAPTSTGDNWRMLTEATPATPWAFTASLNVPLINGTSGSGHFGICVYDGTKIMEMGVDQDGTLDVTEFANVTTGTLNVYNKQQQALSAWWYFQIKDDGTNLIFSYSLDGVNFAQAFSQPRLTFLANTNNIGMCVDNASNSTSAFTDYDWFRRTL